MLAQRQSRYWLLTFTCLLAFSAIASAQDRPKGELFVGFSGRTGGDPMLPGWNASAAVHLNDQLAIVADFSGHYGSPSLPQSGAVFADISSFPQGNLTAPTLTFIGMGTDTDVYSFLGRVNTNGGPQRSERN